MNNFFLKNVQIGLDVDDVLADFLGGLKLWGININNPRHFDFSYEANELIAGLPDEFWENLPTKAKPEDINFLPKAYISKRKLNIEITQRWIEKNGFPCVPVHHVVSGSKVPTLKQVGIEYYVDDHIKNFQDINANGITTFLMDSTHNRQFDVGDRRLYHLRELIYKIENATANENTTNNKIITEV